MPKLYADGTTSADPVPTFPVPVTVVAAVKAARIAGKSDFEIVDTVHNLGAHRPDYYGFVATGGSHQWNRAAVAALRAQYGIS